MGHSFLLTGTPGCLERARPLSQGCSECGGGVVAGAALPASSQQVISLLLGDEHGSPGGWEEPVVSQPWAPDGTQKSDHWVASSVFPATTLFSKESLNLQDTDILGASPAEGPETRPEV